MTEAQALTLGRRAVACRGWRWLPGMLTLFLHRVHRGAPAGEEGTRDTVEVMSARIAADGVHRIIEDDPNGDEAVGYLQPTARNALAAQRDHQRHEVPDFRDPCTVGGLLALVREAWGEPTLSTSWSEWWSVESNAWPATRCAAMSGITEAEALVSALEAAPCPAT